MTILGVVDAIEVTISGVVAERSNIVAIVSSPWERLERVEEGTDVRFVLDGNGGSVAIVVVDDDKGGREGDEMISDKVEMTSA